MANRLALELVADANPFMKGMEQAQASISRFVDASDQAGQAIGGSLNSAIDKFMNFSKGGAAAAGLLAGGFAAAAAGAVSLTASAGEQIEQLDMLSQKTGIALTTLQNWSVVMAENNFDAQSLATGMTKLSSSIVEARQGTGKASEAFKEMGIGIDALGSTESTLRALAEKFSQMPDGPQKAAYAIELLGRSGLDMIPILNRGTQALDESKAAAERFAAVLRTDQVKALGAADDAMDRVGIAAKALRDQLGSVFAPAVTYGAELFADFLGFVARAARDVDTALDTLAIRITHIGLAAKELGSVLFSKDVLDATAWKQALDNVSLIDREAAKLIEKRRALAITPETPSTNVEMSASKAVGKTVKQSKAAPGWHEEQNQHIVEYLANRRAEMALGGVLVQISQREFREREKINQELDKYFETEAQMRGVNEQEQLGVQIVQQAQQAWGQRNDELEMAVERSKVLDEAQQVMFQTEGVLFGNSENAMRSRMDLIEAEGALRKRVIEESIFDDRKRAAAIANLDIELNTKRQKAMQAFPSFFQQQMQAIVQSNSFSISQITTTWTSGLANAAVNGGNFVEQAWKSTQVAVLQGLLNFGIQKAAQLALQASEEFSIRSSAAAAEVGLNTAKNATIVAGDAAAATTTTSIWAVAGATITGTFGAITGAISGFFTATLIPMFVTIGEILMTFLSSIAAAASATIFGIPYGVAILAGVAIIAAAIGSLAAFAFADGGIVTGPTMGMVGEAGSSEAIIPLNQRGAAFMRAAMGGGTGGGSTTVVVELDGRQIARSVFDAMPSVMRVRGITA